MRNILVRLKRTEVEEILSGGEIIWADKDADISIRLERGKK